MNKQFNIGDRVHTPCRGGYMLADNQTTGTVVGIYEESVLYVVDVDNYDELLMFFPQELAHLKEESV
jgi:ribosomal protein L21E